MQEKQGHCQSNKFFLESPRQRRQTTSDSLFSTGASSSSNTVIVRDEADYWQALARKHLPIHCRLSPNKSKETWQGFYQNSVDKILNLYADPAIKEISQRLFSTDTLISPILSDEEKALFLDATIKAWEGLLETNYWEKISLSILLYHRLPHTLAYALYEHATQRKTGILSDLDWALICRQPGAMDFSQRINVVSISLAVGFNDSSLITRLAKLGADLDICINQIPFQFAVWLGFSDATRALITHIKGVNELNRARETPLVMAASSGHLEIVNILIEAGADLNPCDPTELENTIRTPLHIAAESGHTEVVKTLIKAGANVELLNGLDSPLQVAIKAGHLEIVKILMEEGAELGALLDYTDTPLYYAVKHNRIAIIKAMMAYGVEQDLDVLKYAIQKEKESVIDALFEGGFFVSPDQIRKFPWLNNELLKRIQENIKIRNDSLIGRALFECEKAMYAKDEIAIALPYIDHLPTLKIMPIGFTPDGRYFINDVVNNCQRALAYMSNCEGLPSWFKEAGAEQIYFIAALKLVAARTNHNIQYTSQEAQAMYSKDMTKLQRFFGRYDNELLDEWLSNLTNAPEMVAFKEICQALTIENCRYLATESQPSSSVRDAGQRLISDFFKPQEGSCASAASSSYGSVSKNCSD